MTVMDRTNERTHITLIFIMKRMKGDTPTAEQAARDATPLGAAGTVFRH
jgi:hypothetical protein